VFGENGRVRVLGLDLGSKRIGVAVSDSSATIASPLTVIQRTKRRAEDHLNIRRVADDEDVDLIVIGLPITMAGQMGPAARAVEDESSAIASATGRPVELFDERMTTVTADRVLREADLSASARRKHVDKVAAAVMLQTWLDRRRSRT
jgi:putative Holliday junction resolvase